MNYSRLLNYMALFFYVAWAVGVVREDLLTKKISNKRIILALKVWLFLLFFSASVTLMGRYGETVHYLGPFFYKMLLVNLLLSTGASLVLWYGEIWPAGDAKFFIVTLLFIPFMNYSAAGFPAYLWISMLINVFIVAGIYSLGRFCYDTYEQWREGRGAAFAEIKELKEKLVVQYAGEEKLRNLGKLLVTVLSVGTIFVFQQVMQIYLSGILLKFFKRTDIFYFVLFFMWGKIGKSFLTPAWKKIMCAFYALYLAAGWLYFRHEMLLYLGAAVMNVLKFSLILLVGRIVFESLVERKNVYWVEAKDLEPGIMLSSREIAALKQNPVFEGAFDDCFKDGLTEEQVAALKEWLKKLPKENPRLEMLRGRPFAMWIFAGALVAIIFNRNIMTWLR